MSQIFSPDEELESLLNSVARMEEEKLCDTTKDQTVKDQSQNPWSQESESEQTFWKNIDLTNF